MSYASTAGATSGVVDKSCASPRRAWEIAGIILGFVFVWPAALAYLVWKLAGYPMPREWRATLERLRQQIRCLTGDPGRVRLRRRHVRGRREL